MTTTVTYYPEREGRKAARSFLFAKGKVTINQGENLIEDEFVAEFIKSETVQELVALDAIKINGKPELLSKELKVPEAKKPLILDDDEDDDDEE